MLPLTSESVELLDHYLCLERPPHCVRALFVCLKGRARGNRMTPAGLRSVVPSSPANHGRDEGEPAPVSAHLASDMIRVGISLPALMQLMGHAQIQTTLVYVQVTPQDVWEQYARRLPSTSRPYRHHRQLRKRIPLPRIPDEVLSAGSGISDDFAE